MKWRNWLIALCGIWFIVAPWVLRVSQDENATSGNVILGAIQVIFAIWAASTVDVPSWKTWQNWVTCLLGLWFVIHPFLGDYEEGEFLAVAIPGILTMALSLWTLMVNPGPRTGTRSRV